MTAERYHTLMLTLVLTSEALAKVKVSMTASPMTNTTSRYGKVVAGGKVLCHMSISSARYQRVVDNSDSSDRCFTVAYHLDFTHQLSFDFLFSFSELSSSAGRLHLHG